MEKAHKPGDWQVRITARRIREPFIIATIRSPFVDTTWQIDAVSATYGTLDVTNRIEQFLRKDYGILQAFVPNNAFFGGFDPIPNYVKAFILVCRITPPGVLGTGSERSGWFFQTRRFLEGQVIALTYDTTLPRFNPPAMSSQNILILDASYYTLDVTTIVARIAAAQREQPLLIRATNAQFGIDPAPLQAKQLSITYAYCSADGSFDYHVQVVREGGIIAIPLQPHTVEPMLTIHAAYWADLDVTQSLQSRVSHNQFLHIDTFAIHPFDPWYNVSKTLSIMYQYTGGPLQLVVCHDGSDMVLISPTDPPQKNFFNPAGRDKDKLNILAVIWGAMYGHLEPMDASQFLWITEKRRFPCTNEWFKFDGRPNWPKTCHVFYSAGSSK